MTIGAALAAMMDAKDTYLTHNTMRIQITITMRPAVPEIIDLPLKTNRPNKSLRPTISLINKLLLFISFSNDSLVVIFL